MKIQIYECTRTLIYAPIYDIILDDCISSIKNGTERQIELVKRKRPIGDKGVIKKILEHNDPNKIPIGICDPTAILVFNDNNQEVTKIDDIKNAIQRLNIIGNIIDKIAIWLLALAHDENKELFKDHIEKKAFEEYISIADLHDISRNQIFFSKYGLTTNRIFNKYFKNEIHSFVSKPLGIECSDELIKLFEERFILSNTPWLIEGLIKQKKLDKVIDLIKEKKILNPKLFNIKGFEELRLAFTGIITRRVYYEKVSKDPLDESIKDKNIGQEALESFLSKLTDTIQKLYQDPRGFSNQLSSKMKDCNFYCGFEDVDEMGHILADNLRRLISKGIYQYYPIADYKAFINAIEIDELLIKRSMSIRDDLKKMYYPNFISKKMKDILTV